MGIYRKTIACTIASQCFLPWLDRVSLSQDNAQTYTQRINLTVSVGGLSRVAVALKALIIVVIGTQCVKASSRQKSLDHL